jgi:hypothetical protein
MKQKRLFFALLAGGLLWTSCSDNGNSPENADANGGVTLPDGSEYSDSGNWLALEPVDNAPADVFFLYPTTCNPQDVAQTYCAVDDAGMRSGALDLKERYFEIFDTAGVYAPYARQKNLAIMFSSLQEGVTCANYHEQLPANLGKLGLTLESEPLDDAKRAFAHYMEHYNKDRPIIFASHSQGSQVMQSLLLWIQSAYPGLLETQMIAAYLIGVPVTQAYLDTLGFPMAQSATDTQVVISYNTEGPKLGTFDPLPIPLNPILMLSYPEPALAINPANWSADLADTATSEVYGKIYIKTASLPIAGSQSVVVTDFEAPESANWPSGVLHPYDYEIFYSELHRNVRDRIQSWEGSN